MLNKILTVLKIVIGLIGAIFFVRILMADGNALEVDSELQNSLLSPFILLAYIILGLTVVITLVFSIVGVAKGNIKKTLITIGAFAAVVIISFFSSTGKEIQTDEGIISAYASQWISAGLTIFYVLLAISILAIIASAVIKVITSRA
jgi:hypothetical protein